MNLRAPLVACSVALALSGCGVPSVEGTVSDGMPLVGAVVTVTDASGTTVKSQPTDRDGNFIVNTARLTPPFILTVPFTDGDGQPGLMSSAVGATIGGQRANVTPLTSFIVQQMLGDLTTAPSAQQISAAHLNDVRFIAAKLAVLKPLQPLFTALKVPAIQSDPITAPMVADPASDALDNLIDVTHPIVHSNTMVIGEDINRFVESFAPGTNAAGRIIPKAAVQSLQAQLAAGTTTPITNVIVIVGENQTFDSLFGAYQAPAGQTVKNLLSEGMIAVDGKPGGNFVAAAQSQAGKQTTFSVSPQRTSSLPRAAAAFSDRRSGTDPDVGAERAGSALSTQSAQWTVSDHQLRAIRADRNDAGQHGRSGAPLLPDVATDRRRQLQARYVRLAGGERWPRRRDDGHHRCRTPARAVS